jgi:hypothetical protein
MTAVRAHMACCQHRGIPAVHLPGNEADRGDDALGETDQGRGRGPTALRTSWRTSDALPRPRRRVAGRGGPRTATASGATYRPRRNTATT